MWLIHLYCLLLGTVCCLLQVNAYDAYVEITNDGPTVLGGTITFRADLYNHDGSRPKGTYLYIWEDDALEQHTYNSGSTSNTTTFWSISYRPEDGVGRYRVEVVVKVDEFIFWRQIARNVVTFYVTPTLNGNMTMQQSNKTLQNEFVSSEAETKMLLDIRKGDYDYIITKATTITSYWFVDCKFYGQSNDLSFSYNFTHPNTTHFVSALVVVSYEPLTTTTVAPTTTIIPTTIPSNASTTVPSIVTTTTTIASTTATMGATTTIAPGTENNVTEALPYICSNSTIIAEDPKKTYGLFLRNVSVRTPISKFSVEGTTWLQPWEMLSLNISCEGSGPIHKCLYFVQGQYNVTGNETCDDKEYLKTCRFPIIHYFLDASVYTLVVVLTNDINTDVNLLTINIYKVTTKPQLSVIVVPVSCSLAAVVLIVFGVAYYMQSRARFIVEVADFDFGQNSPDMEYKTFTERLRDSFNNAVRPEGYRINNYEPLAN